MENMRTMEQWHEAGTPFSQWCQLGDIVDDDIKDYFLECLPPITWNRKFIQMGEAFDSVAIGDGLGVDTYLTLAKNLAGQWVYVGACPPLGRKKCLGFWVQPGDSLEIKAPVYRVLDIADNPRYDAKILTTDFLGGLHYINVNKSEITYFETPLDI